MADTKRSLLSRRMIAPAPRDGRCAARAGQGPAGGLLMSARGACRAAARRHQAKSAAERRPRIRRAHERLADEKRLDAARAQRGHVRRREDAALGHDELAGGNRRQEPERGRERHVERAQIAVVDADERRGEQERALELRAVVDLGQHRHAELARAGFERREPRIGERRHDQQDRVGADRARLRHLILVDDEILAQHRQRARRARRGEVGGIALEVRAVGQHRQARGAASLVARRDRGRIEIGAQHAAARARLLDLRDDGRTTGRDLRAQGALEVARRGLRARGRGDLGRPAAPASPRRSRRPWSRGSAPGCRPPPSRRSGVRRAELLRHGDELLQLPLRRAGPRSPPARVRCLPRPSRRRPPHTARHPHSARRSRAASLRRCPAPPAPFPSIPRRPPP